MASSKPRQVSGAEIMGAFADDVPPPQSERSLRELSPEMRAHAEHLLAQAARAVHESDGRQVQYLLSQLSETGISAIPPDDHICKMCNRDGQLYCFAVATARARGRKLSPTNHSHNHHDEPLTNV